MEDIQLKFFVQCFLSNHSSKIWKWKLESLLLKTYYAQAILETDKGYATTFVIYSLILIQR